MWSKFTLDCCKTLSLFNKSLCIRYWALFANPIARVALRCKILSLFNKTLCIGYWAQQSSLGNKSTIRYLLFLLFIGNKSMTILTYPTLTLFELNWVGGGDLPLWEKGDWATMLSSIWVPHLRTVHTSAGPTFWGMFTVHTSAEFLRSHIFRNVHTSAQFLRSHIFRNVLTSAQFLHFQECHTSAQFLWCR